MDNGCPPVLPLNPAAGRYSQYLADLSTTSAYSTKTPGRTTEERARVRAWQAAKAASATAPKR